MKVGMEKSQMTGLGKAQVGVGGTTALAEQPLSLLKTGWFLTFGGMRTHPRKAGANTETSGK